MDYGELLSHISIVMQNVILFADTIYENIGMGNQHATCEQVIEAAKKAMIHDFIQGIVRGYDTSIGENFHRQGLSERFPHRINAAIPFDQLSLEFFPTIYFLSSVLQHP